MSLKPDYLIRIGAAELKPTAAQALSGLEIDSSKDKGASLALLDFGGTSSELKLGDRIAIELGWSGERSVVFTGAVQVTAPTLAGIRISAFGEEMKLIRGGRISETFENQTHGDIVKAHAGKAGVATASIEDGFRSPFLYASRQTRYEHCLVLARRLGFDFYANEEGKLVFARYARRRADHVLHFGVDLHGMVNFRMEPGAGATVVPESPASSAGDETASWLVKDSAAHAATEGESGVLVVSDPALRTRDAARQAAQALMQVTVRLASAATVVVGGRAEILLGHAVELKGLEHSPANGVYEVRGVRHVLGRGRGFNTTLNLARHPS